MRGDHYVVISSTMNPSLPWEEALRTSMGVTRNFKSAYTLALSIGEIVKPDIGYKGALERINKFHAILISDLAGSNKITIINVKKY